MVIEARNDGGQFFVFVLIFQSILLIRFIAIKKNLLGKNLDLLISMRNIVNIYCHRYKRSEKYANSFPAPRKSLEVTPDIHYDDNSFGIGVVTAIKQQNTFVKNIILPFILNASNISSEITLLWDSHL